MHQARFPTTRWSLVLDAGSKREPTSREALAGLCEAYWFPIYAYVRGRGFDPDEAQDLTQGYLLSLLERGDLRRLHPDAGRFRSFVRASVKHFISNEMDRARALKRGGGARIVSFDARAAEDRYRLEPRDDRDPERVFERRWALTLLSRAEERLKETLEAEGRTSDFETLRPFLAGGTAPPKYADLAAELGVSEASLKMKVHRLRRRFGSMVRAEILDTVADEGDVDDEIRHLLAAIRE